MFTVRPYTVPTANREWRLLSLRVAYHVISAKVLTTPTSLSTTFLFLIIIALAATARTGIPPVGT